LISRYQTKPLQWDSQGPADSKSLNICAAAEKVLAAWVMNSYVIVYRPAMHNSFENLDGCTAKLQDIHMPAQMFATPLLINN
jgi:hypothetical protein